MFGRTGVVTAASGDYTVAQVTGAEASANKDATGGYAGLTLFRINFKNAANTFTNFFTNATTAARTYTFPDKDITVAGIDDITGTNSGTNTGDQTITLTGGVTGTGTGSFAATVITNANLTGHVTSVGNAAVLGSFTSDQLLIALTNETGTGVAVFGSTPTIATPVINGLATGTGVATANTASTLVARDASGNFAAGTSTAALTGSISGNAATVTTNANLTGPIASSGNTTSITAQTGTGTTFVMNTGPTLTGSHLSGVRRTTIAVVTGDVDRTLAGGQMAAGSIQQLTGTVARSFTLDTGTALSTAVSGLAVGDAIQFMVVNSSSDVLTIAGVQGQRWPTQLLSQLCNQDF